MINIIQGHEYEQYIKQRLEEEIFLLFDNKEYFIIDYSRNID